MTRIVNINPFKTILPPYYSEETLKKVTLKKTRPGALKEVNTFRSFKEFYPNSETALTAILNCRLAKTSGRCPGCDSHISVYYEKVKNRLAFQCKRCRYRIYPLKGTPLERTHLPLVEIFEVLYHMIKSGGHNTTAAEIGEHYGWKPDTCTSLLLRNRRWMTMANDALRLDPTEVVEMDEMHLKSETPEDKRNERRKRGVGSQRLVHVVTMVGRKTGIAKVYKYIELSSDVIRECMDKAGVTYTNCIMTDENKVYEFLERDGYEHFTCNHKNKKWVGENGAHTNSCEGLHSYMKASCDNVHRGVGRKNAELYLNETVFKYTNRNKYTLQVIDVLLNALPKLF